MNIVINTLRAVCLYNTNAFYRIIMYMHFTVKMMVAMITSRDDET